MTKTEGAKVAVAILHRLQWVDAHIRASRYPNTKMLAEAFEISRRQALRDFEYLRDSLRAPLAYSALKRGYYYTSDTFTLPGPYVTGQQRSVLEHLAQYYQYAAVQTNNQQPLYGEMAELFLRLSQGTPGRGRAASASAGQLPLLPYRAVLEAADRRVLAHPPAELEPYWRGLDSGGLALCEFHQPEPFLAALLGTGTAFRVMEPQWFRGRLQRHLEQLVNVNAGATTRSVTSPLLSSTHEPEAEQRRIPEMTTTEPRIVALSARLSECWNSYAGAAHGVLRAAGLLDVSLSQFMGMTGTAFRLIVHDNCDVSAPTTYPWWTDHSLGLDRAGILSEVIHVMPDAVTYDAARRRAVHNIKASVDRGIGVVLWGVDTGEFGVVYGYSDADGVFLVDGVEGLHGESSPILYENVGRTFPVAPVLHYQVPIERVPADLDRTYRFSLQYYVSQMEQSHITPAHHSGLRGYEVWQNALAAGNYQSFGLRYMTYVYGESKQHAVTYAKFLAETWNGIPGLPETATLFGQIAEAYQRMMAVLGQSYSDGPEHLREEVTREQAAAMLPLVKEAHTLEQQAVNIVKRGLAEAK